MKKNYIVVTQTPLRISFFGGGTDMKNFYNKHNGAVLSVAINKYVYVIVKKHNVLFQENIRLNYSSTEHVKKINKIKNRIIRSCLELYPIQTPFYISIVSDIPSGTGLGSSGSITVGILKALHVIRNEKRTPRQLAEEASEVEMNILKNTPGKQDQYAAAYGGFNLFKFMKNKVTLKKIKNFKNINLLLSKSLLIWTGKYRKASKILIKQDKDTAKNFDILKEMYQIAIDGFKLFKQNKFQINNFNRLMKMSWSSKKKLNKSISSKDIDKIYSELYKKNLISSGKILGAGGGGFLFLVSNKIKTIKKNFKFNYIECKAEEFGTKVILKKYY